MKRVELSTIKDQLSRYLHVAEKDEVMILRHGNPARVLTGFKDEDDRLDYKLENDPRFLDRIEAARSSIRADRGVRLEEL